MELDNQLEKTEYYEKLKKICKPEWSYTALSGVDFVEIREGYAKTKIELEKHHMNGIGSVHGGCIFTLADCTGGFAALTRGQIVTSMGGEIHYLNAAIDSKVLYAETIELKYGRKTAVYDVLITDETGKMIAKATMTYYNLGKAVIQSE